MGGAGWVLWEGRVQEGGFSKSGAGGRKGRMHEGGFGKWEGGEAGCTRGCLVNGVGGGEVNEGLDLLIITLRYG